MKSTVLSAACAGFVLLGSLALVPVGGCVTTTAAAVDPITKCTPGAYVYCRCKNRDEGTKLCNPDGHSFATCDPCESPSNPALPDDPKHPPVEVDAGKDAAPSVGPPVCGNGIVEDGEDCDDGNKIEDDGCDNTCHLNGRDPLTTRSCPGLDTHVWSKSVSYVGSTPGSTNRSVTPTCPGTGTGNPTTGAAAADRVFHVTPHKTGTMTVTTSDTNYDSFLYVTTACTPGPNGEVTYLACMNAVNGVGGETLSFPVTAGQAYSVIVDGAGISQQQGAFRVTFAIP